MYLPKTIALAAACALLSTVPAMAATLTQTDFVSERESVTYTVSPNSGTRTSRTFSTNNRIVDDSLRFSSFDSNLGTLTGVTLAFRGSPSPRLDIDPSGTCTDNGLFDDSCRNADLEVRNIFGNVSVEVFSTLYEVERAFSTTTRTFSFLSGSSGATLSMNPVSGSLLMVSFTSGLDRFVDGSDLVFSLRNSFGVNMAVDCDASIGTSIDTCSASLEMEVFTDVAADLIYTFETPPPPPAPVPLPAAAWMLLAGLGGLVAMRRRTATV